MILWSSHNPALPPFHQKKCHRMLIAVSARTPLGLPLITPRKITLSRERKSLISSLARFKERYLSQTSRLTTICPAKKTLGQANMISKTLVTKRTLMLKVRMLFSSQKSLTAKTAKSKTSKIWDRVFMRKRWPKATVALSLVIIRDLIQILASMNQLWTTAQWAAMAWTELIKTSWARQRERKTSGSIESRRLTLILPTWWILDLESTIMRKRRMISRQDCLSKKQSMYHSVRAKREVAWESQWTSNQYLAPEHTLTSITLCTHQSVNHSWSSPVIALSLRPMVSSLVHSVPTLRDLRRVCSMESMDLDQAIMISSLIKLSMPSRRRLRKLDLVIHLPPLSHLTFP